MIPVLSILTPLWTHRMTVLAGIAGALVGFKAGMMVGHYTGVNDGRTAQKTAQIEATLQEVNNRDKTEHEIRALDDRALVRRYCKWVYDIPYDQCVQTVVYVK